MIGHALAGQRCIAGGDGVQDGSIERGVGAVLFQGYNTLLKATETERKIRELDEIEERLRKLEQVA